MECTRCHSIKKLKHLCKTCTVGVCTDCWPFGKHSGFENLVGLKEEGLNWRGNNYWIHYSLDNHQWECNFCFAPASQ